MIKNKIAKNIKDLISLDLIKNDKKIDVDEEKEIVKEKEVNLEEDVLNTNSLNKDVFDKEFLVMRKKSNEKEKKEYFKRKKTTKVIDNMGREYELSMQEYSICNALIEKKKCKEAYQWCIENKIVIDKTQFEECINKLIEYKIIIEIDFDKESTFINNTIIKRNGIGLGAISKDKWAVKVEHKDGLIDKKIEFSLIDKYIVWSSVDGFVNIETMILNIMKLMNVEKEEAIKLIKLYLYEFINLGIWDIDFLYIKIDNEDVSDGDKNIELENEKELYKCEEYTKETLFTSVGCEIGKLDYDSNIYYILKNNKIIELTEEEYECWKTLNLTILKIEQLEFKYSKSQNEIMDEIIYPLLDKSIVIHWDENIVYKCSRIRISNQGNKKTYNENRKTYSMESVIDLGYRPEISEFSYILWTKCSVNKTIADIINEMSEIEYNKDNEKGINEYVSENIRALMSLGLIRVDMI